MKLAKLSEDWATVYSGPHALADLHADRLREAGVSVFVPDTNVKQLDPAAAGGDMFEKRVLVPREREAEAMAILRTEAIEAARAAREATIDPEVELRRLRQRISACASYFLLAPYGVWLALRYVRESQRTPASGAPRYSIAVPAGFCLVQSCIPAALAVVLIRALFQ